MEGALRVATWNVESIRAHESQVLDWVDRHRPHALGMAETRASLKSFPRRGFERSGYRVVVHGGEGGRGGVALASRIELDDVVVGIPGAVTPLDEPRSIAATLMTPGWEGGLRFHTCYAPNGRKVGTRHHDVKLAWFALLAAWLEIDRHEHRAQMLAGDLNIAPDDIDVWDASRYRRRNLTSPPERAVFRELLDGGQMLDVVRSRLGDATAFTWWNRRSDFYETDRGWRLDHVLATPSVGDRVVDVMIDRAERGRPGATDHAPILVTLR